MDRKACAERQDRRGGRDRGLPAGATDRRPVPRLACIDLPALPLQLLLRRQPGWRGGPAAVVAEDTPQAPLLWVNEAARRSGILPGMRHAAALSIDRNLRAGTVDENEIAAAMDRLHRHLQRYSPRVEPARHEPGVFWLDATGLERLYGSLPEWAGKLHRSLARRDLVAAVAVGFTRFGSYALARVQRGMVIAPSPRRESRATRSVALARLQLDPRLRDDLDHLGVRSVGDLVALPAAGVGARFGTAAAELHRLARGEGFAPLQPVRPHEPERAREVLEDPEDDAWRLLFLVKRLLHPLLARLAEQRRAVVALRLDLTLADHERTRLSEELQTAAPSLDAVLLMELVRLRLERLELRAGVERVELILADTDAPAEALRLFAEKPRRDPAAAARALARVRAELGDEAVVRAELRPGHLPEARFRWVKAREVATPGPAPASHPGATEDAPTEDGPGGSTGLRPLVRRYLVHPRPLPPPPRALLRGGPFLVSGGWWRREVRRAYHFAVHVSSGGPSSAHLGELRWVFYDARRRRWRLQGRVE